MTSDDFRVFVAFGGNKGDTEETIRRSLDLLEMSFGPARAISSLYETRALTVDGSDQSDYLNAVAEFRSALEPSEILRVLLETERTLGRDRSEARRWSPRVIDLDLLFAGRRLESTNFLALPHPELHKRDFVLEPLCEIAPDLVHPVLNKTIAELAESLEDRGYERFILERRPLWRGTRS